MNDILPYLLLGTILGLPLLMGLIFRVSSSHLFFSVMAGELLARYFGDEVGRVINLAGRNHTAAEYAEVAVIVLPMILTALFLKGSLSRGRALFHFIPLLITGVVLGAFVVPELPSQAKDIVSSIEAGRQLLDVSTAIIGGVVLIQLIALWLLQRPHESGHGSKKHH